MDQQDETNKEGVSVLTGQGCGAARCQGPSRVARGSAWESLHGRALWGDLPLRVHPATGLLQGLDRRSSETF